MPNRTLVLENQFGEVSNNQVLESPGALACSFIVDATNVNGLGVSGLVGSGIKNVFMHTSATADPANPNPAVGFILVEFEKGYADIQSASSSIDAPNSGTPINVTTGVTAHVSYVIATLGTTSAAQWAILGVPANIVPAVGVAFVAPATTVATGTGTIMVNAAIGSGVDHLEFVGNPAVSLNTSDGLKGTALLVVLAATSSSVTTFRATAPTDGTKINLLFGLVPQVGSLI